MKRFLISSFLVALIVSVSAKTPYEIKVGSICKKYYGIATYGKENVLKGLDEIAIFESDKTTTEDLIGFTYIAFLNCQYEGNGCESSFKSFLKEISDAEKLMNEEDKQRSLYSTDYGAFINMVKIRYEDICSKSDFETSAEYDKRIKDDSRRVFDSLCIAKLQQVESSIRIRITPEKYDIETQTYRLKMRQEFAVPGVKGNSFFGSDKSIKNEIVVCAKMPSNEARLLKERSVYNKEIRDIHWGVRKNKKVVITEATLYLSAYTDEIRKDNGEYESIKIPAMVIHFLYTDEITDTLKFKFDLLGIENNYLSGYELPYSECVACKSYKAMMDSITNKYATDFLVYPYNTEKALFKYDDIEWPNDDKECQKIYIAAKKMVDDSYEQAKASVQLKMIQSDITKYLKMLKTTDPQAAETIEQWKKDYQCTRHTDAELAKCYVKQEKPADKTCKETYEHLFDSENQIDSAIESMTLVSEISKRTAIFERVRYHIQDLNYKIRARQEFTLNDLFNSYAYFEPFKGNEDHDELTFINTYNVQYIKTCYKDLISKYMELDPSMAKEYEKNGYLFKSEIEFFEAYTKKDYKKVVKALKE